MIITTLVSSATRVTHATEPEFIATIGSRAPLRRSTAEDVLETLTRFDTIFIVDDSTSMKGVRWEEV